jgi:hypothetical protein
MRQLQIANLYVSAITSISTSTSLGNLATSTVDLAGGVEVK